MNVEQMYARADRDVSFVDILTSNTDLSGDDHLADLIEADGRWRIANGRPVLLDRYVAAINDLTTRLEPLDAAIDVTLRWLSQAGQAETQAVEKLIATYPDLEVQIRDAAALNNAICTTNGLQRRVESMVTRSLPCDFGPETDAGQSRYELQQFLGEGAFGQVYLAMDRQLSEPDSPAMVAIKVLAGADRSEHGRQRLIEEATKARRIQHPNVVRVLDRGVSGDDDDFIVYEYVGGGDLARWIRRQPKPIPAKEVVSLMIKVAEGIHAAHVAGLVHCDLKPTNILMTPESEPKVADFGIAIRSGEFASIDEEQRLTEDGRPLGNLAFISPEQYRKDQTAFAFPSDVYSLGGILYFLLTDCLPNGQTEEEVRATHERSGTVYRTMLSEFRADADKDLDAICIRALEMSPEDRHSSANDLAEDLSNWIARKPILWTHPSAFRVAVLWCHRKTSLAIASLGIVLSVVTGIGLVSYWMSVAYGESVRAEYQEKMVELRTEQAKELKNVTLEARDNSREIYNFAASALGKSVLVSYLFQTWIAENIAGPAILFDPELRTSLWEMREKGIENFLAGAYAEGRHQDIFVVLWEGILAFWQVERGNDDDTLQLLDRNIAKCRAMLKPTDPWLVDLDAIRACAEVNRLVTISDQSQPQVDLDEARRLRDELIAYVKTPAVYEKASPVRLMAMNKLIELLGPQHLDDADLRRSYEEKAAVERTILVE